MEPYMGKVTSRICVDGDIPGFDRLEDVIADPDERARRQDRLQRTEAAFDPLPFDADAARSYGRVYAAIASTGRKPRGPRAVDLLIAATAG